MKKSQKTGFSLPWVTFISHQQKYAVNSVFVMSIEKFSDEIVKIPYAPSYIRGIIHFRDQVIPVADMRLFFNNPSEEQELNEFVDMLEHRKQDHIDWGHTLKECVEEGTPFPLATDPHQCTFGKWYDHYHSDSHSINHLLNKIDDPHKKLHASAIEAQNCSQLCETCQREECLKITLKNAMEVYIPTVVALLDQTQQVFRDDIHEMLVVLQSDSHSVGIIVDGVCGVEALEFLNEDSQADHLSMHHLIDEIARQSGTEDIVLVLDGDALCHEISGDGAIAIDFPDEPQENIGAS